MSYITCDGSTIYASPACRNEQERAIWNFLKLRVSWSGEDNKIQIPITSSCVMVLLREINNHIPLAMKELTCL